MGQEERSLLLDAFDSNWIAPQGPHVDAFEREFCEATGAPHAAALSSGTAALHLALLGCGVVTGDEVLCSTLTFSASANAIAYLGATPVFIDSDRSTWNMDPGLLAEELKRAFSEGRAPRAVVLVHLYGQSADIAPIADACQAYGVALLEDAAEALGATYRGGAPGTFGRAGIFSFNGNKIITTSGGGMLVSSDFEFVARARFLSQQARDPAPHYQHSSIGFNYRLSNLLAAVGRGQLKVLGDRVSRRRAIFRRYEQGLGSTPGIQFMPEAPYGLSNRWLTVCLIEPRAFGADREAVRRRLDSYDIEARPVWKPLHLQPVFRSHRCVGGSVAEGLFEEGLCLPSGTAMLDSDIDRVVDVILGTPSR